MCLLYILCSGDVPHKEQYTGRAVNEKIKFLSSHSLAVWKAAAGDIVWLPVITCCMLLGTWTHIQSV